MRGLKRKRNGDWRNAMSRRVHFTEHKVRHQAGIPMSRLTLLNEQVDNAPME
jgi:hypothetical protein